MSRESVWDIDIQPRPHRFAWWVGRPLIGLLFLSIVGIPFGIIFSGAAATAFKEHKLWKAQRKANR